MLRDLNHECKHVIALLSKDSRDLYLAIGQNSSLYKNQTDKNNLKLRKHEIASQCYPDYGTETEDVDASGNIF